MKKIILSALALIILASGIGGWLWYDSQRTQQREQAELRQRQESAEKTFIEQMIPHHESAIVMADMALQKGGVVQIKELSKQIITAQKEEIAAMRTWYKHWYGQDVPEATTGHSSHDMPTRDGSNMAELEKAQDFDLAFVKQMIPHHESAVKMAQDVLPHAYHQEIKDLANNIIRSQNDEIAHMRDLQKTFETYPIGSLGRAEMNRDVHAPGR